jgi:hypothetical protein
MAAAGHTCHEMHTHTHHANGSMSKSREGFLERAWGSPHAHALPAADAEVRDEVRDAAKTAVRLDSYPRELAERGGRGGDEHAENALGR